MLPMKNYAPYSKICIGLSHVGATVRWIIRFEQIERGL